MPRTSASPAAGSGIGASTISKSSVAGAPVGRRFSRTCRFWFSIRLLLAEPKQLWHYRIADSCQHALEARSDQRCCGSAAEPDDVLMLDKIHVLFYNRY